MMVEFPGVKQNFSKLETVPCKACKKSFKNKENYETVQIFYLDNLTKPLCFKLK